MTLPTLARQGFADLYEHVHGEGRRPFAWQEELLDRALDGEWPDAVHVPTGLGKTSVLDVAIFALAWQADRAPQDRTAPTRTFFAIDRRAVVDDVYEHANDLARALAEASAPNGAAPPGATTAWAVAQRLRSIALGVGSQPLEVTRMRGGIGWPSRWLTATERPAIVVGTVDQLGSRYLFRGYGVSDGARPIDAALVGIDALWLLDEAHLAAPLTATLGALQRAPLPQPVLPGRQAQTVLLSATLPSRARTPDVLSVSLDSERLAGQHAPQRLAARKPVTLLEVKGSPKTNRARARDDLAEVCVGAARALLNEDGVAVVGVVVNTVATARAVHDRLDGGEADVALVIGAARDLDRAHVWPRVKAHARTHRRRAEATAFVLVATQTVEVGVDLDLDGLVTEAAPWDALVQRAGRVDRLGERTSAGAASRVVVVEQPALHEEDAAPYGSGLTRTWTWLTTGRAVTAMTPRTTTLPPLDGEEVDIGPMRALELVSADRLEALMSPAPRIPVVLPREYSWDWSRTSPPPEPDLPVAPFLHGLAEDVPRVELVWRSDVDVHASGEELQSQAQDSITRRPPTSAESIELPLWTVRRWLAGLELEAADVSDASSAGSSPPLEDVTARGRSVARIGGEGSVDVAAGRALRSGDTLLLPADVGGLDAAGWAPESDSPVEDLADVVQTRAGALVRLAPRFLERLDPVAAKHVGGVLDEARDEERPPDREKVRDALIATAGRIDPAQQTEVGTARSAWRALTESIARGAPLRVERIVLNDKWEWRVRVQLRIDQRAVFERRDGDDSASIGDSDQPVSLDQHQEAVANRAANAARRLGLDARLSHVVETAARLHDLGKAEPRFQRMLGGGDAWSYLPGDPLRAKSGMDPSDRGAWAAARVRGGVPRGFRHEAISVALIELALDAGAPLGIDHDDRELLMHLVGTHHGRGRAVYPPVARPGTAEDVEVDVEGVRVRLAAGLVEDASRGWSQPGRQRRLVDRHGAWGLALLETVVRLADQECSEAGT